MKDNRTPTIYLFHDAKSNTIRAAVIERGTLEPDDFPKALSYMGRAFQRITTGLTFWDYLSHDGNELSPVLGICLNLLAPDDTPLLASPFCTAKPTNVKVLGSFLYEIELARLPENYSSDSAQAFGSQYYSDGTDVIVALDGWTRAEYAFPLDRQALLALD